MLPDGRCIGTLAYLPLAHVILPPCSNVLLDEELRAHISDLGVARVVGQSARSVAGFHWVHAGGPRL